VAVYQLGELRPAIAGSAYVAAEATLIGQVTIGERSSVWSGAVVRADNEPIRIGNGANIQEGAVIHADPGFPATIGDNVTVGHQAMLHGCTIGESSLIGIQAVILNGATIGRNCLVAAGALVTEGKSFPDRSLILGSPAKVARSLSDAEVADLDASAADYIRRAATFKRDLQRVA
jgi:carbonic anhydrase/acetyltransferase-like protein (isoleucine patch superfamily)